MCAALPGSLSPAADSVGRAPWQTHTGTNDSGGNTKWFDVRFLEVLCFMFMEVLSHPSHQIIKRFGRKHLDIIFECFSPSLSKCLLRNPFNCTTFHVLHQMYAQNSSQWH